MIEKGSWTVSPMTSRIRLDQYLTQLIPDQSRSQIQHWIRKGDVRVNGIGTKTGYLVRPGDSITFAAPPREIHELPHPEEIPLDVLFEDADLAVIDKPAGMVCHAGAGVRSGTLVNALLHRMGPMQAGDPTRPGIVHRLDKSTSGLMVVAKNSWTHRNLTEQFRMRLVRKEYLALVYGRPKPERATINLPLGRDPQDRKKISVRARKQRSAVTHYQLEKECGAFSLLRVRIETGRTHQIRVHLAEKGHPVLGDPVYGDRRRRVPENPQIQAALGRLRRFFLHAQRLEFRHPRTGDMLCFTSPLPVELAEFLALLQK